eukprot:2007334-Pleurochrysis_carterae.AAC.1
MKVRFGGEEGRHDMQVLKRTLCRIVCRFAIRQVEGSRERVGFENDTREVAKGVVKGCDGRHERHELERCDAVSTA